MSEQPNPSPAPLGAEQQRERLAIAIRRALDELGIPQPGYPAPVTNAVEILRDAVYNVPVAAPRAPSAAAIEGLAAEWYEESYGQGWHDATKDEQRDFRARAKTQLDAAYAIDRPARPVAPSPAGPWYVKQDMGAGPECYDVVMRRPNGKLTRLEFPWTHNKDAALAVRDALNALAGRASGAGGPDV